MQERGKEDEFHDTLQRTQEYGSEVFQTAFLSTLISLHTLAGRHSFLLCYPGYPLCVCCQLSRLEITKAVLKYLNINSNHF